MGAPLRVEVVEAADADAALLAACRAVADAAFDGLGEQDWQHALGGWHVVARDGGDGDVVAHAAVVERTLVVGERALRAGYLEAVAVLPERQGTGVGTVVVEAANELVRARFELGALSTSSPQFYERLGWQRWAGPTSVRLRSGGLLRTEDEDDGILVLPVGPGALDRSLPISCEERDGDDW